MGEINYIGIVVASIVAFVASFVWYMVLGKQSAKYSKAMADAKKPEPWKMFVEFCRNLVVACVLIYFLERFGVKDIANAVEVGMLAWIGFPLILLAGSVMYEKVPWQLAGIHAGDWLVKLFLMSVILSFYV